MTPGLAGTGWDLLDCAVLDDRYCKLHYVRLVWEMCSAEVIHYFYGG